MILPRIPPLLLRSSLRYQWRHRWQALLALTGIALGVAVVLAVDLANSAARASFALSAAQLRGAATHRLQSPSGHLPQSLYQHLFTTPGHPPMAPLIKHRTNIPGQTTSYLLLGVDVFSEGHFRQQYTTRVSSAQAPGDWLTQPGAVVIDATTAQALGLQAGAEFEIEFRSNPFSLTVFAIDDSKISGGDHWLIVDIATAQAISGDSEHISYIDLILDEHSWDWIEHRIPAGVELIDLGQQTEDVLHLSAAFELNLTAMSLLALLVGLFLIFNAMNFSIVQRHRLFGRLRVLGVTQSQLYGLILAEAVVLGIIGSLIGTLLGVWLGHGLTAIVAGTISELYYQVSVDAMQIESRAVASAMLLGIGGALLGSWVPAAQASRIPPLTTLSRAASEQSSRRRLPFLATAGTVMLLLGLLVALLMPGGVISAFGGLLILLIGCALITPLGLPLAQRLLSRLPIGGIWRMATRDLDRHLSRLATAAAALMVALSATVGVSIMVESMRGSVSDWLQQLLNADVYIAAEGFEQGAVLDAQVVRSAHQIPTLRAISLYRNQILTLDRRPVRLVAASLSADSRAGYQLLTADVVAAWSSFDEGALLISEPLANRLGLERGNKLSLPTASGEKDFTIGGVLRDFSSEHGRIYIDLARYRQYWPDLKINTLALFSSQQDSQQLMQQSRRHFAAREDLEFTPAAEIYRESMEIFGQTFRITEVLRSLLMVVALIGIFSALMAVQLERRKEFAVLRALGLTRSQLGLLIIIESLLLGLVAALMALPTGLAMAWVLTDVIQLRAFGWSMPFIISVEVLWQTLLLGLLAAFFASLYPAWRASHGNPSRQLRED